jgi:regulation of enolase protein 1 (concanavalin A-like superfamily)
MLTEMKWLNEPGEWSLTDGVLRAVTEDRTDFWRETFYGWVTDSGHFYYRAVEGDFSAEVTVEAAHDTRFDQAGMMVRGDARNWLKAGLEVTSGQVQVSTVCTRDFSDLSVTPVTQRGAARMRVSRFGTALAVHLRDDDGGWQLLRLAHLDLGAAVDVGVMCCSPERAGLVATFRDFEVGPTMAGDLE